MDPSRLFPAKGVEAILGAEENLPLGNGGAGLQFLVERIFGEDFKIGTGLVASISRRGCCYDNATMESFWSTLKHELIYRWVFKTRAEARLAIVDYIETFYNRRRLHSSLNYKSPVDFESQYN